MIDFKWHTYHPPIGPATYKLILNNSVVVGTVRMAVTPKLKYVMCSSLPIPRSCADVFRTTGIHFDTKEDAMDACENITLTWIKESKLLED